MEPTGMARKSADVPGKRDWRISAVLLAIWLAALAVIWLGKTRLPLSMLAIATVFFVMLIPAMNDLVSSIHRYFYKDEQVPENENKDTH